MEKPTFLAGSLSAFSNFISGLKNDKIALISHTDLDGLVSAKIANQILNADFLRFADYEDLNDNLVKELEHSKIRKVIFTDLLIKNLDFVKSIEKFAEIMIIDHHPIQHDFNSPRTVFLNAKGFAASYLCYYLFSKIKNLDNYDWLVACACISDFCYFSNNEWMKKVFSKYGDSFVIEEGFIKKQGKFWDLQYGLSLSIIYFDSGLNKFYNSMNDKMNFIDKLKPFINKVQNEVEFQLKIFEKEKVSIKDGYFFELSTRFHICSILINAISIKYPTKTIIFAYYEKKYYYFSARRQDKLISVNSLLTELIKGIDNSGAGGHDSAAGGSVLSKDALEFKKRVMNL